MHHGLPGLPWFAPTTLALQLRCSTIGYDLGLREGNWSFAIVADFTDGEAYRAYDQDPAHNHARAGLLPLTEQIARIQFEMP